jgi:hypothetical protein
MGNSITPEGRETQKDVAFAIMGLNYGELMSLASALTEIIENNSDEFGKEVTALALWNWAVVKNQENNLPDMETMGGNK